LPFASLPFGLPFGNGRLFYPKSNQCAYAIRFEIAGTTVSM
jgi:hypothetical protein